MVRYKPKGKPNKAPPKSEFEFRYYDLGLTAEQMAELYKVKPGTIYNWATKFRKEQ